MYTVGFRASAYRQLRWPWLAEQLAAEWSPEDSTREPRGPKDGSRTGPNGSLVEPSGDHSAANHSAL